MNYPTHGGARDRVALVTGAGSGIGRAIAMEFARSGMRLCLVGRRESALAETASVLTPFPAPVVVAADLRSELGRSRVAQVAAESLGRVDVLVHAAGDIYRGAVDETPVSQLDDLYQINVRAPFALTQAVLPLLRESRGQVIFINSSAGIHARATASAYAATKHALRAVADALRDEVDADGVRVCSLFLGRTATDMQERVHLAEGVPYRPDALLQPEDVAAVVAHVASLPAHAEVTDLYLRPMRTVVQPASRKF